MAEIADELRKIADASKRADGSDIPLGMQLRAAADALDAAHKRIADSGWQPIETAPTNRAVLIHLPGLDYYGNDGVYAGMLVDMGTGKRWMTFGWAIGRDVGPENEPDAWMPMPLPAPPSRIDKEDRNGRA